jgi:glycine/D-amino acid oxidase-like deaminating enzyme
MTHTIQVERFSISFYHGVAAVVFPHGSFTIPCSGQRNPAALTRQVSESARQAQVAKLITRTEIKKIASALSTLEEQ